MGSISNLVGSDWFPKINKETNHGLRYNLLSATPPPLRDQGSFWGCASRSLAIGMTVSSLLPSTLGSVSRWMFLPVVVDTACGFKILRLRPGVRRVGVVLPLHKVFPARVITSVPYNKIHLV